MKKYVSLQPNFEILSYTFDGQQKTFLQILDKSWQEKTNEGSSYEINNSSAEILLQFDGTKSLEDIIAQFSKRYNEPYQIIENKIKNFLEVITCQYKFKLIQTDNISKHSIAIKKFNNLYPSVVSVELTSNCNLLCKHCYGSFGECKRIEIPKEELKPLFDKLAHAGVLTVELTGGDPSTYRYIAEAIDQAIASGIRSIMLLTNGVVLSKKLIDAIERHKENILVQIDLHSLDSDYFNWFTGSLNKLKYVQKNIDLLVSKEINIRVVTIVTKKNYKELIEIADWAYKHGAIAFAASTVVGIGRANGGDTNDELLLDTSEIFNEFVQIYKSINQKYPGFIRLISEDRASNSQCGAILSSISIKPNGNLKLCPMDTGEYFNLGLGNIFKENLTIIYKKNSDFIKEFSELQLPDAINICKECPNALYCNKCILRGLEKAKERAFDCAWYQNYLPDKLKSRFFNN